MREAEIDKILKQQMPIEEKCNLSDFVIETYNTQDTELQVIRIVREIEGYLNA
jgi:dephospho-CoA kinase